MGCDGFSHREFPQGPTAAIRCLTYRSTAGVRPSRDAIDHLPYGSPDRVETFGRTSVGIGSSADGRDDRSSRPARCGCCCVQPRNSVRAYLWAPRILALPLLRSPGRDAGGARMAPTPFVARRRVPLLARFDGVPWAARCGNHLVESRRTQWSLASSCGETPVSPSEAAPGMTGKSGSA